MPIHIDQQVPVDDSYAAERTRGLYNVDAGDGARFTMDVELPIEEDLEGKGEGWQIGAIVGPSGSGKSSILRELKRQHWGIDFNPRWPKGVPVITALTDGSGDYAKATAALAAVGLGSVPSWLRPRNVLSMGEGFRADMARMLLSQKEARSRVMLDEFTSVLDRQVAQIGAQAFAKAWRREPGRRIIVFSCHYDILDWLQPDWWLDTADGLDMLGEDREVVHARKGDFQETSHRARYRGDRVGTVVA